MHWNRKANAECGGYERLYMRVGVVTFWSNPENYGSQLQCYALQQYLSARGHDPYLIRWTPDYSSAEANTKPQVGIVRKLMHLISPLWWGRFISLRIYRRRGRLFVEGHPRCFEMFREKHIKMSRNYSSINDLRTDPPGAEAYICGSDQVWNWYFISEEAKGNFLDFGPPSTKRVAFAASIGVSKDTEEYYAFARPLLNRFDAISVRESSGVEICKRSGGANPVRICDPTLLMNADNFSSLTEKNRQCAAEPNVICYFLNISSAKDVGWTALKGFFKAKGMRYAVIPAQGAEMCFGRNEMFAPTVEGFLDAYRHAQLVVTNSFHGVAMSIIFHKKFVYIPQNKATAEQNVRVLEILKETALDGRIMKMGDSLSDFEMEIDWHKADAWRNVMREKANQFLSLVGL